MHGMEEPTEQLSPLIRRVLADNPSPFTFTGTQSFIIGRGEVAIIDPGPDLAEHVEALLAAVTGERIAAIVCTHTHRDHSPAARRLQEATGAPIVGCAPLSLEDTGPRADDSFDPDYRPDNILAEGEELGGDGWTLQAVSTPGHTSNHLCYFLREEQALFSGDHVMGWSTTIVSPPDGDMAAYMASLLKLQARDDRIYYPAHGPAIEAPQKLLRGLVLHRRQREGQILAELKKGEGHIPQMVSRMYKNIDPHLHPAAGRSVLAHLLDLEARGLVTGAGDRWSLLA
jgi:glyoxylase-like metal-dependent hydrolase (beta-lactamase superfamily II)